MGVILSWPQYVETETPAIVRELPKIYNIGRTKSQNLNESHLVLQLSLPYPLKPDV